MNTITLLGRLGKDPVVSSTDGGTVITKFSLAVDRSRKNREGNKVSDWFNCRAFGKTAEVMGQHLKKGSLIVVTGAMQAEPWVDRDNSKKDWWEVAVERFSFAGSPPERREEGQAAPEEDPF